MTVDQLIAQAYRSYHTGQQIDQAADIILGDIITQWVNAARQSADAARQNADAASESASRSAGSAIDAKRSADRMQSMARTSESWAVGGTGTRTGEDTDNSKYYSKLARSWAKGGTGVRELENADNAKYYAQKAKTEAHAAASSTAEELRTAFDRLMLLAQSWAVGQSGIRQNEDTDNSKYYSERSRADANRAQAYAEQTTVPIYPGEIQHLVMEDRVTGIPYEVIVDDGMPGLRQISTLPDEPGIYNAVMQDEVTGDKYIVIVENRHITFLGVSDAVPTSTVTAIDILTGILYGLHLANGKFYITEVE